MDLIHLKRMNSERAGSWSCFHVGLKPSQSLESGVLESALHSACPAHSLGVFKGDTFFSKKFFERLFCSFNKLLLCFNVVLSSSDVFPILNFHYINGDFPDTQRWLPLLPARMKNIQSK